MEKFFLNLLLFSRFSQQELKDGKSHVNKLTDKWFQDIQVKNSYYKDDQQSDTVNIDDGFH